MWISNLVADKLMLMIQLCCFETEARTEGLDSPVRTISFSVMLQDGGELSVVVLWSVVVVLLDVATVELWVVVVAKVVVVTGVVIAVVVVVVTVVVGVVRGSVTIIVVSLVVVNGASVVRTSVVMGLVLERLTVVSVTVTGVVVVVVTVVSWRLSLVTVSVLGCVIEACPNFSVPGDVPLDSTVEVEAGLVTWSVWAGSVSASIKMAVPGAVGRPRFIEGASTERKQPSLDVHWKGMQWTLSLYHTQREGIRWNE